MNDTTAIGIGPLSLADAHDLAPLIAAYAQELSRGAPRRPDDYYAELLLKDRTARLIGARLGERMVGFAVFFDMPDTVSGMRVGQLDELFVVQDARGLGVGDALIGALIAEGRRQGWQHVRWLVREKARIRDEPIAADLEPGGMRSYIIPVDRTAGNR
jgi:GNAT superfamily N-acetyltransferase